MTPRKNTIKGPRAQPLRPKNMKHNKFTIKRKTRRFQQKSSTCLARKLNLFFFVRVLLKYLEHVDPQLRDEAEQIVKYCAQEKREGNPLFEFLDYSIQTALRLTVGERHWSRAKDCYMQLVRSRNICTEKRDLDSLCIKLDNIQVAPSH
mmetsp:Transcript_18902/g.26009  ORF Transcript_18902/g.26009 Transcript_18902/m.26009 type:complete len:149 (-) Transcript_18902:55-501(-)